jgi:hypothetical protein
LLCALGGGHRGLQGSKFGDLQSAMRALPST